MIFVTVGTHEQPFNRLVAQIDHLVENRIISELVVMQTGFSTYIPKYCEWQSLYSFSKMNELISQARVVITHGGPSSFIMSLQMGKIPIVVPRQKRYNEHVNDHQVDFCREVVQRYGNIIIVEEIEQLGKTLTNYNSMTKYMKGVYNGNNEKFCKKFENIVNDLMSTINRK